MVAMLTYNVPRVCVGRLLTINLKRMTAEQILEKHLLLMLKRTDESYESIDEMKQQPEWQAVINAMLEYGEIQALRIHDVVGRSEQLVCPNCKSKARMQNGFIWCENDDCGGIYRAK